MTHHFCFLGLSFSLGTPLPQLLGGLLTEDILVDSDTIGADSLTTALLDPPPTVAVGNHGGNMFTLNALSVLPAPHLTRSNTSWLDFAADFFPTFSPSSTNSPFSPLNSTCSEFWGPDPVWAPIAAASVLTPSLQLCCFSAT